MFFLLVTYPLLFLVIDKDIPEMLFDPDIRDWDVDIERPETVINVELFCETPPMPLILILILVLIFILFSVLLRSLPVPLL